MAMANETILHVIETAGVALIGSVDNDGFPNIKAMLPPRKQEGLKRFYFTTNTSSLRVEQFKKNEKACLYFYDKRFYRGIMIIGTMKVLTDQKMKNEIWKDGDTQYYSLGVTDPDYCVLEFTSKTVRVYQNYHSDTREI